MDELFLRTIFESSGNLRRINLPQEYVPLVRYLQEEIIILTEHRWLPACSGIQHELSIFLSTHPQHLWEVALPQRIPLLATIDNGGGSLHQLLCWRVAAWLIDQGYETVAEQRFSGKRVDLITLCKSWLVECGDTAPMPIARHLLRGITSVGVVPFQDDSAGNGFQVFTFTKGKEWCSTRVQKDQIIKLGMDE